MWGMKERRRAREEGSKSQVHHLFPISEEASVGSVEALNRLGTGGNFAQRFFERCNKIQPEIVALFFAQVNYVESIMGRNSNAEADFWLGAVYAHEAVRREAQIRGGVLPRIDASQIGTYVSDHTHINGVPIQHVEVNPSNRELF